MYNVYDTENPPPPSPSQFMIILPFLSPNTTFSHPNLDHTFHQKCIFFTLLAFPSGQTFPSPSSHGCLQIMKLFPNTIYIYICGFFFYYPNYIFKMLNLLTFSLFQRISPLLCINSVCVCEGWWEDNQALCSNCFAHPLIIILGLLRDEKLNNSIR